MAGVASDTTVQKMSAPTSNVAGADRTVGLARPPYPMLSLQAALAEVANHVVLDRDASSLELCNLVRKLRQIGLVRQQ